MEVLFPILPLSARAAPAISQLALDAFARFIAPAYSKEGRDAFARYAASDAVRFRLESGEVAFGAFDGPELIGVIEMRGASHIALLFVAAPHHRRGVGRALVEGAIGWARAKDPDLVEITLNSSPYALPIYHRLGFLETGPQVSDHGILSTPMALRLKGARAR